MDNNSLESLVLELRKKDETRAKWYIGPIVTVMIAVTGVFVSWGMMMKTTEYLQAQVESLSARVTQDTLEITQLKIVQAKSDALLMQIKDDIREVKDNVKELVKRRDARGR